MKGWYFKMALNKKNMLLVKACSKFLDIDNVKELKKNGLSLSDRNVIHQILLEFTGAVNSTSETLSENVAKWFEKNGFNTKRTSIGWKISL